MEEKTREERNKYKKEKDRKKIEETKKTKLKNNEKRKEGPEIQRKKEQITGRS